MRVDSIAKVGEIEEAEKAKMRAKVNRILAHGMDVFISRQLIYNYPEQLLTDAGKGSIEHADFEGVERLAAVLGGLCWCVWIEGSGHRVDVRQSGERASGRVREDRGGDDRGGQGAPVQRVQGRRGVHDRASRREFAPAGGGGAVAARRAGDSAADAAAPRANAGRRVRGDGDGGGGGPAGAAGVREEGAGRGGVRARPAANPDHPGQQRGTGRRGTDRPAARGAPRRREERGAGHVGAERAVKGSEGRGIGDMEALGIYESLQLKRQVLLSATEAAEMIVRVDEVIKSAPRERMPDAGRH